MGRAQVVGADSEARAEAEGAGQLLAELPSPLRKLQADEWSFDYVVYDVLTH